jgi:hypothetical protein
MPVNRASARPDEIEPADDDFAPADGDNPLLDVILLDARDRVDGRERVDAASRFPEAVAVPAPASFRPRSSAFGRHASEGAQAEGAQAQEVQAQALQAQEVQSDEQQSNEQQADGQQAGGAQAEQGDLLTAVERLRSQVARLSLTLEVEQVQAARKERESLLRQLDDYLLPRLRRRDAPLLAVIGGSTGAGKSTLTNSLVRREVSRSGVLRPTTRSPVLVHHPYDSGAFMSQRILPRLNRITSEGAEPLQPIDPNAPRITALRLVPHDGLTPGMALIDAPDIDSLVETNRDLAVQLLAAADLWIFVTTAARYADAMPWEMLKQAADRGVAVAVVLDRVPPEALSDLRVHLATRLRDRGLGGAPLFAIPETQTVDGFLPERIVAPLQTWLKRVAGDERSRTVIADRTLKGIVTSIPERANLLADAANAQTEAWTRLQYDVDQVFSQARADLLASLTDGSLLSGDVRVRWQEHLADGDLIRRLDGQANLGDRLASAVRREGEAVRPMDVPVTLAAAAAIQSAARSAMDDALALWNSYPFGAALLEARGHQLHGADIAAQIEFSLTQWRDTLVDAAEDLAAPADGDATVDAGAASDVVFVAAIDDGADRTGGSDPGEGGSETVSAARRILATFAGEEEVRSVISAARADLVSRAAVLLDSERLLVEKLLEPGGTDARRGPGLREAAHAVELAR